MQDSLAAAVVKQLLGMNADRIIASRVPSETKVRLRALAEHQQLSESALLKRLVEMVLHSAGHFDRRVIEPDMRAPRGARLYVRLRAEDRILLQERAAARGMPSATYVSVLIRAHLRKLPPLPKDELVSLKNSVAALGAIARNLNQIAMSAHCGRAISPLNEDLRAFLKVCSALRDNVKGLIKANLKSWEIGHGETKD